MKDGIEPLYSIVQVAEMVDCHTVDTLFYETSVRFRRGHTVDFDFYKIMGYGRGWEKTSLRIGESQIEKWVNESGGDLSKVRHFEEKPFYDVGDMMNLLGYERDNIYRFMRNGYLKGEVNEYVHFTKSELLSMYPADNLPANIPGRTLYFRLEDVAKVANDTPEEVLRFARAVGIKEPRITRVSEVRHEEMSRFYSLCRVASGESLESVKSRVA